MNVFELFGIIAVKNEEANSSIEDTRNRATKLASTFGTAFKAVGGVALTCGKVVAAGLGAGAAAMGALIKSATSSYAEYEQLVGGVNTLFKDSSNKLQQYAAEAFKNQGMSANQYMSTVTSFSASLIKSLKGDTEKAAELANLALTDMADNANKMGTSMGSIQDAYQGFAKQNYTMLDNLKLGYGGTKSEMQRLLKDAQKIKKAQGENVKYSIDSFADIVEAIHVVQTEMGITGTTALEANETIAGSFQATSAAWQDLLVGIASGNQDLSLLIDNFAQSVKVSVGNIKKILPNIVQGLQQMIQLLAPELSGIIEDLFPALLDGAIALIGGLIGAMPSMLNTLGQTIGKLWSENVWPAIQSFFKINFDVELPDWGVVTSSIEENLAPVINNLDSAIANIKTFFADINAGMQAVGDWMGQNQGVITAFLGACAIALAAVCLPAGLLAAGLLLLAANWELIKKATLLACEAIETFFTKTIPEWWQNSVIQPILDAWAAVETWINDAAGAIGDFFTVTLPAGWNSLTDSISGAWSTVVGWINSAITALKTFLGLNGGSPSVGTQVGNTVTNATGNDLLGQLAQQMVDNFGNNPDTPFIFRAKGAVFSKPTLFDTRLGKQVVGEAGPEAVAPIDVLRQYVREEVEAATSKQHDDGMKEAFQEFAENLPEMLANAFSSMRFDVNGREFARLVKAVT